MASKGSSITGFVVGKLEAANPENLVIQPIVLVWHVDCLCYWGLPNGQTKASLPSLADQKMGTPAEDPSLQSFWDTLSEAWGVAEKSEEGEGEMGAAKPTPQPVVLAIEDGTPEDDPYSGKNSRTNNRQTQLLSVAMKTIAGNHSSTSTHISTRFQHPHSRVFPDLTAKWAVWMKRF